MVIWPFWPNISTKPWNFKSCTTRIHGQTEKCRTKTKAKNFVLTFQNEDCTNCCGPS